MAFFLLLNLFLSTTNYRYLFVIVLVTLTLDCLLKIRDCIFCLNQARSYNMQRQKKSSKRRFVGEREKKIVVFNASDIFKVISSNARCKRAFLKAQFLTYTPHRAYGSAQLGLGLQETCLPFRPPLFCWPSQSTKRSNTI